MDSGDTGGRGGGRRNFCKKLQQQQLRHMRHNRNSVMVGDKKTVQIGPGSVMERSALAHTVDATSSSSNRGRGAIRYRRTPQLHSATFLLQALPLLCCVFVLNSKSGGWGWLHGARAETQTAPLTLSGSTAGAEEHEDRDLDRYVRYSTHDISNVEPCGAC